MKYETTLDFTAPIKASMHEIEHTLIEAIILVLIVVYVFLQSFRATIIPMSQETVLRRRGRSQSGGRQLKTHWAKPLNRVRFYRMAPFGVNGGV